MQPEHVIPMKANAPFSVIVGGLARFTFPQATGRTARTERTISWVLRDVQTGQTIKVAQQPASDRDTVFGELVSTAPLRSGAVYQTLSVDAETSAEVTIARAPHAASPNRLGLVRGTRVMTTRGEVPVERLRLGDRIVTRDRGMQSVRWIGRQLRKVTARNAPVIFQAGAISNARDLLVSSETRVVVKGADALARYGAKEVLVPARQLIDGLSVTRAIPGEIVFYQIVTDRHEIIYAEAAAVESFLADEIGQNALDPATRSTLQAALPNAGELYGPAARDFIQ